MNTQDAYTNWSTTYDTDRNLTRDLDARVTREALDGIRIGRVLEIGCGTGKNTEFLAQISVQLRALDFSDGMLAQARAKVDARNVEFAVADLTQPWPCESRSVELVVGNLVLEHIEELGFVFSEAARVLVEGGQFFACELHPGRQYLGKQANFTRDQTIVEIPAFTHHISDFTDAANNNGFSIIALREWWHTEDQAKPPRLISFMFRKRN